MIIGEGVGIAVEIHDSLKEPKNLAVKRLACAQDRREQQQPVPQRVQQPGLAEILPAETEGGVIENHRAEPAVGIRGGGMQVFGIDKKDVSGPEGDRLPVDLGGPAAVEPDDLQLLMPMRRRRYHPGGAADVVDIKRKSGAVAAAVLKQGGADGHGGTSLESGGEIIADRARPAIARIRMFYND